MMNHPYSVSASTQPAQRCAVLVMSCDAYEDLWAPCFNLFAKYWPDCPFPVYLGAECRIYPTEGVVTLHSSAGSRNWTGRLADYLGQLQHNHDHVLLFLDDFFLRAKVPTIDVLRCWEFASTQNAVMLRLIPRPKPTRRLPREPLIGEAEAGSPYRLSTQAAIWSIPALREILRPNESIWDFEHKGNERTSALTVGFFSVWRPVLPYEGYLAHHVVEKGAWFPHEKYIFSRQDIGCNFSRRKVLPMRQLLVYHAAQLLEWSLSGLPWRQKRAIKGTLKRLLRPFMDARLRNLAGRNGPGS